MFILATYRRADLHADPGLRDGIRQVLASHDMTTAGVYMTQLVLDLSRGGLLLRVHRHALTADGSRQVDPDDPTRIATAEPVDLPLGLALTVTEGGG